MSQQLTSSCDGFVTWHSKPSERLSLMYFTHCIIFKPVFELKEIGWKYNSKHILLTKNWVTLPCKKSVTRMTEKVGKQERKSYKITGQRSVLFINQFCLHGQEGPEYRNASSSACQLQLQNKFYEKILSCTRTFQILLSLGEVPMASTSILTSTKHKLVTTTFLLGPSFHGK